jgi:hypothetical protein
VVVSSVYHGVGMATGDVVGGGSAHSRWRWAGEQGSATRLTGGTRQQRGTMVSGGVREEERKARQHNGGAPTGGPGPHSARRGSNSVLNRFKNIQTVQIKFEFLKTLAGSKDTSLAPKI